MPNASYFLILTAILAVAKKCLTPIWKVIISKLNNLSPPIFKKLALPKTETRSHLKNNNLKICIRFLI